MIIRRQKDNLFRSHSLVLRQYHVEGVLVQESASSSPILLAMIAPGVAALRYMGPAMLPRRALPDKALPHRNSHQTYAWLILRELFQPLINLFLLIIELTNDRVMSL